MGEKLVFDIETNGLLSESTFSQAATLVWMVATKNVDTGEECLFCDYTSNKNARPLHEFKEKFNKADVLIGHNIISFDLPILDKLWDWVKPDSVAVKDTLLMSQFLDYKRFLHKGHSLKQWGSFIGEEKKGHEEWDKFSEEMVERCISDVSINLEVYKILNKEVKTITSKMDSDFKTRLLKSLRNEHDVAEFAARCEKSGWVFNKEKALEIRGLMRNDLDSIEAEVHPLMPHTVQGFLDTSKKFRLTKKGYYYSTDANYFGVTPESAAFPDRVIEGCYSRVNFVPASLSSPVSLKKFLFKIGWKPLVYNWKKNGRIMERGSPKLCSASLNKLGNIGKLIDKYNSTKSRLGVIEGWLSKVDNNNRIRGQVFIMGTPTCRSRHSVITNVPAAEFDKEGNVIWGADGGWKADSRHLFTCEKGYKVVGSDSSGNQMRALCHYLSNNSFTNEVLKGDIHKKNAAILGCARQTAKTWLYAFIFGAGFGKLGMILTGKPDVKIGKAAKSKFEASTPGIKKLKERLEKIYSNTYTNAKPGFIPAIDGRKIYSDSPHTLLNYLLQSAEAITCKAAVSYTMRKFKEEGIVARPLIFYHDEQEWAVREDQVDRAKDIMANSFKEAPKQFGINIMEGVSKVGNTWHEVH